MAKPTTYRVSKISDTEGYLFAHDDGTTFKIDSITNGVAHAKEVYGATDDDFDDEHKPVVTADVAPAIPVA
jgi:hypothetical protein